MPARRAVIEPDTQIHLAVGEHTGGNGLRHVRHSSIAQVHRKDAASDRERDGGGGLTAGGAGTVIAPVGGAAVGVDEGELKLAGAGKVDAVDGYFALVADDTGHLGEGRQGGQCEREQGKKDGFLHSRIHVYSDVRIVVMQAYRDLSAGVNGFQRKMRVAGDGKSRVL